jgi:hypothetical protein
MIGLYCQFNDFPALLQTFFLYDATTRMGKAASPGWGGL